VDKELVKMCIQRVNNVTHARWASGQPQMLLHSGRRMLLHMPFTSQLPCWRMTFISETGLRQSIFIYFKDNPAKVYPSPIFWRESPQQEQQQDE